MIDFANIEYLKNGTPKQCEAYKLLTQKNVLFDLVAFNPMLVGTIPINIDVDGSDLDILCCWYDKLQFIHALESLFGIEDHFQVQTIVVREIETVVANFRIEDFELEIFGQPVPVREQHGFRHMLIEYEILQSKGEVFRKEIVELKKEGYKTEPAFALLLGIEGDPYIGLLEYKAES